MAIGFPPLIPLDRVIPDPNARFERFGEDNTELFGKPLLTSVPNYQPSQPAWEATTPDFQPQRAPALAPDYSMQAGNLAGRGSSPASGTLLDLTV